MIRYSYSAPLGLHEDLEGEYVKYTDYVELSDYADSLVDFSKIPCLPKDLENLRNANAYFAEQNCLLEAEILKLKNQIAKLKKSTY